jgi:hypothetical protein
MLKVEINIPRDILHYLLDKLAAVDIEEITVIGSESIKPKTGKFDTSNNAKIEFVLENNMIDNILQLLLTDQKIQNGRIDIIDMEKSLLLGSKEGKRFKIVLSTFIKASRDDIYAFITNFTKLQYELPEYIKSIDIINSSDNSSIIEEELSIDGMIFKQLTRHTMHTPAVHEIEVLSGYLEGSRIVETYTDLGNGTEIMIICDFVISKELEDLVSNPKEHIENSLKKIINHTSRIIENKFVIKDDWK